MSLSFLIGYQVTGSFYACPPSESQTAGLPIEPSLRSGEAIALSGKLLEKRM